ncbi:hypothetical protein [Acetonema longum]|nr:hypothetical protein [Acetonema longum]
MGERIVARREALGRDTVYGILDGDFIKDCIIPINKPRRWDADHGRIHFGWRWERKEIENYLLDPLVIERALGNSIINMKDYTQELKHASETISIYQAARTALASNRRRLSNLSSAFGLERGKEKHLFPEKLDEISCVDGICETIDYYTATQGIQKDIVLKSFTQYKQEC